jgi:hypothetical protein
MRTYNSFDDIARFISDQPLCCPSLYKDDYHIVVSHVYLSLLRDKGFVYGEEIPEITEEEFWECFVCGELTEDDNQFRR